MRGLIGACLCNHMPSLCSKLSKSRSCMEAIDPSGSPQSLTYMCQQPACHEKAVTLREKSSTACLSALLVIVVPML